MAIKCKGCVHRSDRGSVSVCNYQQNTGHCKIVTAVRADGTEYKTVSPVENCAFFEPGRRRKPTVETWRLAPAVAKIDYRLIYKLYLQGLTDRAVAEKFGCNVNTVWAWRKKNNLPANRYKKAHGASFS